jgi:nitroreductase
MQGAMLEKLGNHLAITYDTITSEEKYSAFKRNKVKENPTKSAVVIAICMQRDLKERVPEWEEVAATAMAVQNLWLAAHSLGIGGYWSSPALKDHMVDFLSLADGERCLGFFYLGYVDETMENASKREPLSAKITWM